MAIITVSRTYGSGGSEVAERIAHELAWQLLDNAFVDEVAARLGTPAAEVEAREERVPSLAQRLAATLALGAPEILPGPADAALPPSEERLIEVTERIIIEAAGRGHSVIVGRGAQSALVARTARRLAITEKEAEKVVYDTNRQREQYVRTYWRRSWLAHENYHLCLNTDWLGLDGAAEIVVRLARQKFATPA